MRTLIRSVVLGTVAALAAQAAFAGYSAKVTIRKAPSSLDPGKTGDVTVDLENDGDDAWPIGSTKVILKAIDDPKGNTPRETTFDVERTLKADDILLPGQSDTLGGSQAMEVEAPSQRGEWTLQVWVEVKGSKIGKSKEFEIEVTSGYNGKFTTVDVDDEMELDEDYEWKIKVENTGNVAWDPGDIVLKCKVKRTVEGSSSEGKKAFEREYKIDDDDLLYDGDDHTFEIDITTPDEPGEWDLEWQLYDKSEREYFGSKKVTTVEVIFVL